MKRPRFGQIREHAFFGALFSLGTKVGGSLSMLAMFALASLTLDFAAFGQLVIIFNIVSLVAVAAVLGQDTLIKRSWGEYVERDPELARGAIAFGLGMTLAGMAIGTLGFLIWEVLIDGRLSAAELVAVSAYLCTQTLLFYVADVARVVLGTLESEPPRELFWRLPLVAVLGVALVLETHVSILLFFGIAAVAQFLTIAHLARRILAGLQHAVRTATPRFLTTEWFRRSVTMTTAAVTEAAHQYSDTILIGYLLGPGSAANYFVITRIANVFSMLTSGIHTYSVSRISHLAYLDRFDDLRRLMAQMSVLTIGASVALLAFIAIAGTFLLGLFGAQYCDLYGKLFLMSLVTGAVAMAGPGPMLMLIMGADALYLKLVFAALVVRIAALSILAPIWEVPGAIAALALATLPLAISVSVICIRQFGV
ncbi:MAG: hypothetical protein P4L98_23695, partial [Ancalomicrobiaceae bacterium]|nr:hypothetical protein [Ancalomicrobiaceae bacterium]